SFSAPGVGGDSAPVIQSPDPPGRRFASVAGVSYNASLGRYLATFAANTGFYFASSDDGIHWSSSKQLLPLAPEDTLHSGDSWLRYPTLLSPSAPSDRETNAAGYLYYAKGVFLGGPGIAQAHTIFRRSLRINGVSVVNPTAIVTSQPP